MKKKHTYESVAVETIDVAAFVAAMLLGCMVPGGLAPATCIVALDVAKERFFAALANARGEVLRIVRFNHPKQTMMMVQLLLELTGNNLDVQVVLETGTYGDAVKHQCHERGLAVYEVSPKRTHDMAEVLDGVPSMHDAKATVVLAQLHAMGKSRRWEPPSAQRRALRAALDRRVVYSEPLEQHYGRLEALLARYWPELHQVITLRESRSGISLLSQYPGPEAVVESADNAKAALRAAAKGTLTPDRIDQIVQSAVDSLGLPMTSDERGLLGEVVGEIQRLKRKVDEIDEQIASHVDADEVMKLMSRVVGPAATTALIAHVGAPARYGSASAYQKACGLNLKVRSSGKHEGRLMITKRGPPRVRQLLYLAALRCSQSDPVVRAWYQQRGGYKGNVKMKAVVAVMRKLVRALWCIGRDPDHPKPFDSHLLFDVRRLQIQERVTGRGSRAAKTQQSSHPGQTRRRTRRAPECNNPSTVEAHT